MLRFTLTSILPGGSGPSARRRVAVVVMATGLAFTALISLALFSTTLQAAAAPASSVSHASLPSRAHPTATPSPHPTPRPTPRPTGTPSPRPTAAPKPTPTAHSTPSPRPVAATPAPRAPTTHAPRPPAQPASPRQLAPARAGAVKAVTVAGPPSPLLLAPVAVLVPAQRQAGVVGDAGPLTPVAVSVLLALVLAAAAIRMAPQPPVR